MKNERFLACLVSSIFLLFHSPLSARPDASRRRWTFPMEETGVQSPAIGSDGTIYIGTGIPDIGPAADGMYAIRPDGTLKWKCPLGLAVHSSVALDWEDNLYFIAGNAGSPDRMNAVLVSLDSSGILRWTSEAVGWMVPVPNAGFTPAVASDGTVYACGRYSLYAFSRDGARKWRFDFPLKDNVSGSGEIETTGSHHSAPTVGADGTIYVNTQAGGHGRETVEGGVFAIDPGGTLKWRTRDIGGTAAPVIGADGTIYSAVGRYEAHADTSDWPRAAREARLLAINPDGTLKWSVTTLLWIEASPSIGADGTLYAGTTHHPLCVPAWFYAISPDGLIRWKYDTYNDVKDLPPARVNPPDIYNSPAVDSNGRVYFGNEIGLFYAMSPDGKVEWMDDDIWSLHYESPALADDGTLYVATHSILGLIAMNTGSQGLAVSPWPKFRRNNANTGNAHAFEAPVSAGQSAVPGTCELYPNCPNPFNPETTIAYRLAAPGFVNLCIFDVAGRQVRELVRGRREEGRRQVRWNGTGDRGAKVQSGVYICRMRVESGGKVFRKTQKLCLAR
jgi:hypothetical protein